MKKTGLIVLIAVLFTSMVWLYDSYYIEEEEYNIDSVLLMNENVITKTKEFKKELNKLRLDHHITSSTHRGFTITLSKYELNRLLHSKEVSKYISSYQRVKDIKMANDITI